MKKESYRVSLSISPFTDFLCGKGYTFEYGEEKASTPMELQKLYMKAGATEVFGRLCTARKRYSENIADHSLESTIEKACIARDLGLPFNPEVNLFAIYGDVLGQPGPDFSEYEEIKLSRPWEELTVEEMCDAAHIYGAVMSREILQTGVHVNIWDIGNEVNLGFGGVAIQPFPNAFINELGADWYKPPDAIDPEIGKMSIIKFLGMSESEQISWMREHVWPFQFKLMTAFTQGIESVDKTAKFTTHTTWAHNTDYTLAFAEGLLRSGFKLDCMGLSYYPSADKDAQGRYSCVKDTITRLNKELGLESFIAEYAYPASQPEGPYNQWCNSITGYDLTPDGQAGFLRDFLIWGLENNVCGIRPWAPELAVAGWEAFAIFEGGDHNLVARPALTAFNEALR